MNYLSMAINKLFLLLNRPEKKLTSFGSWAIITGASDGIGKAMAKELFEEDLNLILIGRNREKLQNVVNEVSFKYASKMLILALVAILEKTRFKSRSKILFNGFY
ncbi:F12A21.14 [Cryptosporidium hominis TU502]|uniref:F12A21.14 n=1 Tax=Cryptosporidium hominis (strain TU502) TaxID=353151 RepID=UPI0000453621|nr:F12A21.14 [Cryptosporidium hominis TU502]